MRFIKCALTALSFCLVAASVGATTASPVNGDDFKTLDRTQSVSQSGKVEVTEFFAYWCPHCNAFDPELTFWVKTHSDKIIFNRVPVAFHDGDEVQQKMYYALEALGKNDALHASIFRAIHIEHRHLNDEAAVADFVASQGVDRAKFISAFESFGVSAKVQRATMLLANYKVDSVPTIAIDGRFETSPSIAGAKLGNLPEPQLFEATLKVMDWLVTKSASEHKQAAAMPAPVASAAPAKAVATKK